LNGCKLNGAVEAEVYLAFLAAVEASAPMYSPQESHGLDKLTIETRMVIYYLTIRNMILKRQVPLMEMVKSGRLRGWPNNAKRREGRIVICPSAKQAI
jgi:hypothetical protein